jgi:hypothetical protein
MRDHVPQAVVPCDGLARPIEATRLCPTFFSIENNAQTAAIERAAGPHHFHDEVSARPHPAQDQIQWFARRRATDVLALDTAAPGAQALGAIISFRKAILFRLLEARAVLRMYFSAFTDSGSAFPRDAGSMQRRDQKQN